MGIGDKVVKSDIYFRPAEGRHEISAIIYHIVPIFKKIKKPEVKEQLAHAVKELEGLEKSLWIAQQKLSKGD
jgi:hypothetical protein